MKPPVCVVCHEKLTPDGGGLVSFAKDPEDADWYRRAEAPGFVGHPPHLAWFCAAHVDAARAEAGLTRREALSRLRPPSAG